MDGGESEEMYLQKRRRKWWAMHDIPRALRDKLGKDRFAVSLNTEDKSEAERRAPLFEARWRLEIDRARENTDIDPLEQDALFWRKTLANAHEHEREIILDSIREHASEIALKNVPGLEPIDEEEHERLLDVKTADRFFEIATGKLVRTDEHLTDWQATLAHGDKAKDMKLSTAKKFCQEYRYIQDVTRRAVQEWATKQIQEGRKPRTVRRMLSELRNYWDFLISLQVAPEDSRPFDKLSLPSPRAADAALDMRKPFTAADVVRLLGAAEEKEDASLADLIRLGMWSGARIEELCSLKCEKVHDTHFEIEDAKTAAGWRSVPIHPKLAPHIARLKEVSTDGYILPGLPPNKYGDRSNSVGKRFGRMKMALGFGEGYVFHSIRKTVATLLENAGVPENVAADIIGHDKPTMTYGLYSGGNGLAVMAEALGRIDYPST